MSYYDQEPDSPKVILIAITILVIGMMALVYFLERWLG